MISFISYIDSVWLTCEIIEHSDGDGGLVVLVGAEGLGLLGGDSGVPLDQGGHHSASSFDSKGEWGNVEEQQVRHCFRLVA